MNTSAWSITYSPSLVLIVCSLNDAAQNAADQSQLGTVQVPGGSWLGDLPPAWRQHMDTQLSAFRSKSTHRTQSVSRGASQTGNQRHVPLDQGIVNGIMRHVSDEDVRQQVCRCNDHKSVYRHLPAFVGNSDLTAV